MELKVFREYKKFAPLYILQVLARHTDEQHALTYKEICELLEKDGFEMERKAVSRYAKDLVDIGVKIHGVSEKDEEDKKGNAKRGIWLEKDLSDENLQMLIDSVLYSKYISKTEAEELITHIRDMGSATFKAKNKGIAKLSSIYHARETGFFRELNVIQQAIAQEKKVKFAYGSYKENNGKFEIVEKANEVSPYHLVFANGKYYLIGYHEDKKQIWHFRVDKIFKAKIVDQPVKPIRDTKLKGISIGDYMLQHPYLFTGDAKRIVLRVNSEQFGHIVDTFGEGYNLEKGKSDKLTTTVSLMCNEDDAYYWALQFGGIVEVLEPQELRERLRVAVEEMAMRYSNSDMDRYNAELRRFEQGSGTLELKSIGLKNKTKHHKLNVHHLTLSDNQIEDISFVKNYARMSSIRIFNNPISDLSALAQCPKLTQVWIKNLAIDTLDDLLLMGNLRGLDLDMCEDVDGSAIYKMDKLESLRITGSVKNLDVEELKKQRPSLHVHVYEKRERTDWVKSICAEYPLNVLREAIGYNNNFVGDIEEATRAVDKMLLRLPREERDVAELVFKENLGEAEISDILAISVDEIARRIESYKKKITHKSYNQGLIKFLEVRDPNSSNPFQKLWDMVGLSEEERKRK